MNWRYCAAYLVLAILAAGFVWSAAVLIAESAARLAAPLEQT